MTDEKKAPPGNGASSKSTGGESEANLSKTAAPDKPRTLQNKPAFVSGQGQYHSNEPGAKKRKPYLAVTLADIRAMVDSPPSVPKENGRWFIPSTLPSRTFDEQRDNGEFWLLWADLDKDPRPLAEVADTVLYDVVDLHDFEVYASRSARHDYQKGRVFIPLAAPLSGADWLLCQKMFNDKLQALGFTPDRKSEGCGQLCYLPNRGDFYESHNMRSGTLFDPLTAWRDEIEAARTQTSPRRQSRDMTQHNGGNAHDPVVDYLFEKGLALDVTSSGDICVECPEIGGHSGFSGPSETVWHRAGTGGFARGHFDCKHQSCKEKISNDQDFLNAIGYNESGFEVIEIPAGLPLELPAFTRDNRGKIEPTRTNLVAAIARPGLCGRRMRFDTFLDDLMFAKGTEGGSWQVLDEDVHPMEIALYLESGTTGFKHVPEELLRRVIIYTCKTQIFDAAQDWMATLVWDGMPRVADFLTRYVGAEANDYTRAVSLYWWSALAGRVIEPGVKADMALIAIGEQGLKKSSIVKAMVPVSPYKDKPFYGELDLAKKDDELARDMRGKLVMELSEMKGFNQKAIEHTKSFISRQSETWTPKYKEFTKTVWRRCMFFGTTNHEEILVDETGNRRWLPFRSSGADPAGLVAVCDQLWAEGAHLFRQHGVMWEAAERLARDEHDEFTVTDAWDSAVHDWLYTPSDVFDEAKKEWVPGRQCPADREFEISEALSGAVLIKVSDMNKGHEARMGKILKRFGFEKKQERIKKGETPTADSRSRRRVYRRKASV